MGLCRVRDGRLRNLPLAAAWPGKRDLQRSLASRPGRSNGASGGYGSPSIIVDKATSKDKTQASGEATPTEWRTPPLWGVASSSPYLHDGRANTIDEAIRLHGGEAAATSERYTKLSTIDHNALILFLRSLSVSGVRPTKHRPATAKRIAAKSGAL